ncbi:MAG: hypothetical protein WBB29_20205 [Geitlerinemataceae cyanobacterium]
MPRKKKVIYYTVPEYADTLLIAIEARQDSPEAREQALEAILAKMDDENDTTLDAESFADGLGIDRLVVVESPESEVGKSPRKSKQTIDRELEPIEVAAAEIAQFSLLRVGIQELQETAKPYVKVIEALFGSDPLTAEQIEIVRSKEFAKTLSNLATAKVEYDTFAQKAKEAWEILKPVLIVPETGRPKSR